jgi:hypothetical protein
MEPITSLLDAFIKLADRLINLEKAKLQNRQTLFKEFVKPLFEELEPVASNYMDFFRKARRTINRSTLNNLRNVVDKIKNEREAMSMARTKVREMAKEIEESINDQEVVEFAKAVKDFFYSTPVLQKKFFQNKKSKSRALVRALENVAARKTGKENLIVYIDNTLENLEASWVSIVRSYEKLKIHSIVPPKFVRKRKTKKTKPR